MIIFIELTLTYGLSNALSAGTKPTCVYTSDVPSPLEQNRVAYLHLLLRQCFPIGTGKVCEIEHNNRKALGLVKKYALTYTKPSHTRSCCAWTNCGKSYTDWSKTGSVAIWVTHDETGTLLRPNAGQFCARSMIVSMKATCYFN